MSWRDNIRRFSGFGIGAESDLRELSTALASTDEGKKILAARPWYRKLWATVRSSAERWLRIIFRRPLPISKRLLLMLATEMYHRDLLTAMDVVRLETNMDRGLLDPTLVQKVKRFADSGAWKTIEVGNRAETWRLGIPSVGHGIQVMASRPRVPPLPETKAAMQQSNSLHYRIEEKRLLEAESNLRSLLKQQKLLDKKIELANQQIQYYGGTDDEDVETYW